VTHGLDPRASPPPRVGPGGRWGPPRGCDPPGPTLATNVEGESDERGDERTAQGGGAPASWSRGVRRARSGPRGPARGVERGDRRSALRDGPCRGAPGARGGVGGPTRLAVLARFAQRVVAARARRARAGGLGGVLRGGR